MTSAVGFKVPCPSCSAPITLKSMDFVGKKVDCPKCKYRFVVPAPADSKPKDEAGKGKKKKSNRDKVNEEIVKVSKKKSGSKMPLIIAGIGIAVFLIVAGVFGFFFMSGDDKPITPAGGGGGGGPVAGGPGPGGRGMLGAGGGGDSGASPFLARFQAIMTRIANESTRDEALKDLEKLLRDAPQAERDQAAAAIEGAARTNPVVSEFLEKLSGDRSQPALASLATGVLERLGRSGSAGGSSGPRSDPTNLMPNETTTLLNLHVGRLVRSEFRDAIFTFGAFKYEDFDQRMGVNLGTVEQIVIGCNRDHRSILVAVRTLAPYDWDELRGKLKIEEKPEKTVKGKTYHLGRIDFMAEFLRTRMPPIAGLKEKAAFHRLDDHTLVYGDEETMKKWLDNPPTLSKPTPPTPGTTPGAGPIVDGSGGQPPQGGSSAPGELPSQGGGVNVPRRGGMLGAGGGAGGSDGVVTPTTARDTPGQGPAGTPGGTVAVREEPYSTIDPALRTLIMLAEDHKESIGVFADSAQGGARDNLAGYLLALKDMPMAQQTQVTMLAMALQNVLPGDDHIFLRGALACKDRREGENVRQQVETALANIAKRDLRTLLGLEFKVGGAAEPETQGDFARSGPPALSGGGQAPQGGQPPARAGGGAGMGGFRLDDSSGRQAPPSGGGGFTLGGPPTVAGSPETPVATAPEHSTITVTRQDEIILVTVDVNRKAAKSDRFIESSFGWIMVERRAEFEIGAGQVRVADLAGGLLAYRQGQSVQGQNAIAPFGALPRRFESERGRPYPPSERVSFFADLMPYFSERMVGIREGIDPNKSWKDPDNVRFGRILVSELITPGGGRLYTRVSGVDAHLAVTQFVGMAGVGPDAPYYPANHPLAGVFGYDRQTRLEDIRDGASTTIMLIQVDGDTTGPWIAGGGATVRGTSPNCDRDVGVRGGFRSPNHGGKEGVWVVMADGSVRFLSRSISPNVFKALCTMAGGDDPGDIDLAAPRQKLETFNTRTARPGAPATPAAPPRPRVKEEDDH